MPTVKDVLAQGFRQWYTEGKEYCIGVIRRNWLQGPRPQRLGVVSGNLRNRVWGKVLSNGFAVGTNVLYGIMWELGIKAHEVVAKRAKVLAIPVKLVKGTSKSGAKKMGVLKTGKGKGLIFRKRVWIPKQEPRKWLEPGMREALPQVQKMGVGILMRSIQNAIPNRKVSY